MSRPQFLIEAEGVSFDPVNTRPAKKNSNERDAAAGGHSTVEDSYSLWAGAAAAELEREGQERNGEQQRRFIEESCMADQCICWSVSWVVVTTVIRTIYLMVYCNSWFYSIAYKYGCVLWSQSLANYMVIY